MDTSSVSMVMRIHCQIKERAVDWVAAGRLTSMNDELKIETPGPTPAMEASYSAERMNNELRFPST